MAVYTHITDAEAAAHLTLFDIGTLESLEGIREGVSNTNYRVTTDKGRYILTLVENPEAAEGLLFITAFMAHLGSKGVPCPGIVTAKDGAATLPLQGKPALITTFLEGESPKVISTAEAASAGALLGRMHRAADGFTLTRDNAMGLPAWKGLLKACGGKTDILPFLVEELFFLERNRPQGLPAGGVHADLFPDNVFLKDGHISGVIDFYFACTETFAYDLMLTLNAWCFDGGTYNKERADAFLAAYAREWPLSPAEKAALPYFGRAAALRIIATRLYDKLHPAPGALITPKDPNEHIRILNAYRLGGITL